MSLYLAIFDGDREVVGWVLGHYSDFAFFRDVVEIRLSRDDCPTLLEHSDCDGEWTLEELAPLRSELEAIAARFKLLAPEEPRGAFEHAAGFRRGAKSLYDCFHNVDGENLLEALSALCDEGIRRNSPIAFQ